MLTRKEFLTKALEVTAATLGLTLLRGCSSNTYGGGTSSGGGGAGDSPGGDCLANGTKSVIATNHGHVLVVSKDDVGAAADKTYDIRGTADHTHTVAITAQLFDNLAANEAIMVQSSLDGSTAYGSHTHLVMVACV